MHVSPSTVPTTAFFQSRLASAGNPSAGEVFQPILFVRCFIRPPGQVTPRRQPEQALVQPIGLQRSFAAWHPPDGLANRLVRVDCAPTG